jgi:hypothetical protein
MCYSNQKISRAKHTLERGVLGAAYKDTEEPEVWSSLHIVSENINRT